MRLAKPPFQLGNPRFASPHAGTHGLHGCARLLTPFPFVNSPMTAREDGGHVKLPLAFVAPASEIPLEEGVDYSAIIAALLRVSSLLDVFFPWCLD